MAEGREAEFFAGFEIFELDRGVDGAFGDVDREVIGVCEGE